MSTRKENLQTISRIADRGLAVLQSVGVDADKLSVFMDIDNANHVCPLDLDKLEAFDDGNFAHDIIGIYRHLNRETQQLENYFTPRCAKTQ